jgi:hypothetical protein
MLSLAFPLSRSLMLLYVLGRNWLRGYKRDGSLYTSCSCAIFVSDCLRRLVLFSLDALIDVKTRHLKTIKDRMPGGVLKM